MRSANWPCRKIASWLAERDISISAEGVRQFCKVRGIRKAQAPTTDAPPTQRPQASSSPPSITPTVKRSKKFHYRDDGPIEAARS